MVDGEVATYCSCRVYVDTCFAMGHLGDDAWDERYAQLLQLVSYPVATDGAYTRVAADDFTVAGGCRVALIGCFHIGGEEVT